MKRILSFVFFIMFTGIVFSQNLYSLKYTIEKEHMVIPVSIEGIEFDSFVFDSGSGMTHLTNNDFALLKEKGIVSEQNRKTMVKVTDCDGRKRIGYTYIIPCLCVGKMKILNLEVVFTNAGFRTLGYDVMKRFDKISIDIQNKTLNFEY